MALSEIWVKSKPINSQREEATAPKLDDGADKGEARDVIFFRISLQCTGSARQKSARLSLSPDRKSVV